MYVPLPLLFRFRFPVMAEERFVLLRLQPTDLQCTVCMGHYNCPSTLPCGHTFCRVCIEEYWRDGAHCNCPICQKAFPGRPELSKNTDLAALVEALHDQEPRTHDNCPRCMGPGATKLCLPCMATICPEHQLLHRGGSQRHLLVTVYNAGWPCRGHERGLQYFCISHSAPLCPACVLQHQECEMEPLLERYKRNRERLEQRIRYLDEKISSKEQMIGNQKDSYREIQIVICDMKDNLTRDFREMRDYLEKQERASFWRMQQEQEAAQKAASQEMQLLLGDIEGMNKEKAELQECIENDWIAVLKDSRSQFSEASTSSPKKHYSFDENRLVDTTDAIFKIKTSMISHPLLEEVPCPPKQVFEESLILQASPGANMPSTSSPERSVNRLLQWATHISFDPQTVNNRLALSDDLKTVTVTNKNIQYEKSERRFTTSQVLCLESFSSQCCYWEISTKDSHGWGVGAATADMARDGKLGRNNLSWCVEWSKDRLCAWHNNQDICVAIPRPLTIGVLLDLQEQKLTFYSISADSQILIHVYNLQRQGPIFPAVWLYGLTVGNSLTIRDIQRINMSHQ